MRLKFLTSWLRVRLFLVAFAAAVPALALTIRTDLVNRETARRAAVEETVRLTRLGAAQMAAAIEGPRLMLGRLAETAGAWAGHPAICTRTLLDVQRDHPGTVGISFFEPSGVFVCGTEPGGGVTARDPAFLRQVTKTSFSFLGPDASGRPVFLVAYPTKRLSGEVDRVIVAANRFEPLDELRERFGLSDAATVSLFDRSGGLVARSPDQALWLGRTVPAPERQEAGEGAGIDGVARFYSTAQIETEFGAGLSLGIGVARSEIFQVADAAARRELWLAALVFIGAIGVVVLGSEAYIIGPIGSLKRVVRRVASGDLTARARLSASAPGFHELGETFNEMVTVLELREQERDQAESARQDAEDRYRGLFLSHPHPMWVYDLTTLQFLEVNEAAVLQYGFSRDEFLQMRITDVRPSEDLPRLFAVLRGDRQNIEHHTGFRHRLKNGHIIDVDVTSHLLTFEGRPAALAVAQDVTERQQNAKALDERNRATAMIADVGLALNGRRELAGALQACAEAIVQHLPDALVRIWTSDPAETVMILHGCAGRCAAGSPGAGAPEGARRAFARHRLVLRDREYGMVTICFVPPVPDEVLRAVASVVDHIALAVARDLAEEARRLLAEVVQSSDDAITSTGLDGRILSWNHGAENLYGYTAAEAIGRHVSLIVPADRPGELASLTEHVSRGRNLAHYETVRQRRDGSRVSVSLTLSPIRNSAGTVIGGSAIARDITERQRAERAVREAEERMRFALEASQVGIWEANLRTGVTYWSETCEALHGLESGAFGRTFDAFFERVHPDDRPMMRERIGQATRDHAEAELEYRTIWPSGEEHWIRSTCRFSCDPDGVPLRGAGIVIDITERRRLEDQFRQAQKMEAVGRLAGGVAHDFNNLLTAILGYAELLTDEFSGNQRVISDLGEIRKAAESAARLTRQLLTFSRKQVVQPQVLSVNDVVTRAESLLRRTIGEDILLVPRLDPSLQSISADPGQLEQIIMNLALNARDAMPHGGQLTIETTNVDLTDAAIARGRGLAVGPHVMLAVSDTGTGMEAAVKARMFEPFFTTKPEGQGTGLGLATVYGIVKQSGGVISVYSEPGKGTSFKIYFPCVAATVAQTEPVAEMVARPGTETVLVVEDQDAVRAIIRKTLTSQGYHVLEASQGSEALEIVRTHSGPIHLMLTDVVMPTMGGRELADHVRTAHPAMRVMFMSGYTEEAVRRGGILESDVPFLQKPFSPDMVRVKVRQVLDGDVSPSALRT